MISPLHRRGRGSPSPQPSPARAGEGVPGSAVRALGWQGYLNVRGKGTEPLALALLLLASCGYSFHAGESRLPPAAARVFVRPFENHTSDAEAGALVAAALRRELSRRGAEGGAGAPARLEGVVEDVSFAASSPNGSSYRLALTLSARLTAGGTVLGERRVRREEDWLAGLDPLESEGRRRIALRRAAEAAARELIERFEH